MTELKKYLVENYPKDSKAWHLIRVSFFNNYHCSLVMDLLDELNKSNKDSFNKLFNAKLHGAASYSTYEWLRIFDKELADLRQGIEAANEFIDYFEVKYIQISKDKFSNLVHGEGYTQRTKFLIRSMDLLAEGNEIDLTTK